MKGQSTGGTSKNGYKKLKPESMGKSKASGSLRGNAGRKPAKKK